MKKKFTFLIAALFALMTSPGWGQSTYTKVTSTSDLTDGQYLIVYETGGVALDGTLTSDVAKNTVEVIISNGEIASSSTIDAAAFTFNASNGSFLGGGGKYIGHTGTSNTLNYSDNPLSNTVSIDNNKNAVIDAGSSYVLRFNKTSGQERFRFYKGSQELIQLYKKQTTPSHTLTFSADNGSITAMNGETVIESGNNVAEGAELNITATANDWYKFSGWNVSGTGSTLGSTTANPTTFTMGTADATLTATFADCVVTVNSNNEDWGIALYDDDSHTISTLAENGYRISTTEPYTIVPADAATLTAGEDGEYIVSGVKDQDVEITINFEALPTATYTVTFSAGTNGTCSTTELIEEEAGAGVILPNCTPNAGYQFVGWATSETATEAEYEGGATYYPTANITLHAVYNEVYTITWSVNGTPTTDGNPTTSVVEGEGITTLPTAPASISGMAFQGWTATQIETPSTTAPTDLFTDAEHAPAITANTTFYAVFAEESEGDVTWNLANDIAANDVIIIATNKNYNSTMKTAGTISSNLMSCTASTFNSDKTQITSVADGTLEFTLGGNSTSGWTLQNGTNYLGMSGDKKVALSSTSSTWSISISSGVATVSQTYSSKSYSLQYNYNNGNDRFTGYTSGQTAISLYKKTQDITYTYYTNVVVKTLTSITLSGEYPTEFWKGDAFSHEGMTVTAHYSNADDEDVTSKAEFSTPDMSTVGVKTITVSYETASTTYGITVKTIANTQETAYTVAEAKELIDANPAELTTTEVYVKGTVSKVDGINDGAITYWLDNNTFEVYKGKNVGGEAFTNVNQISVNDDVTIRGKIKKYYSTYEFDAGNYLVSHVKVATLSINDITVEIGGTITPVIETNVVGDYTISYTSDNEEVVLADGDEMVTMGLGEATITATLTAEGYKNATTTFTVEVIKALESIAVKTPPTTTSYKVGDFFNPAGLVITANYNDESTEDVTYAENEDKFTFEPSLETPLTQENESVTITYAGKSTTQTISVRALSTYNITWMANGEAVSLTPATVIEGNEIGTLPTPEAEYIPEGFTFAGWSTSMASTNRISETYVANENLNLCAVFAREISNPSVEEAVTIIDGSQLTSTATSTVTNKSYDNHVITFSDGAKCQAVQDGALNYFTEEEAILIGKKGKHIYNQTPFDNITKFEIYANKGASAKVSVGINFSTEAIDSYNADASNTWAATLSALDNVYDASEALPTGAKYFWYQVTNDNNSQVQFRITYQKTTTTTRPEYYTRVYDEDTELASLTVAGPSIILSGKTLTVTGTMENTDPANLIIEDGGQLIHHNAGVTATVQKNITGYGENNVQTRDGYYLIANPTERVANDEYDALDGCAQFDLYTFDPTAAHEWVNKGSTDHKVLFERNVGYLFASAATTTLQFRGELLPAGEATIDDLKYYDGNEAGHEFPGFNLIGNPFACNAYVQNYSFYTIEGDAVVAGTGAIAPCQGFMIETDEDKVAVELTTQAPEPATAPSAMSIEVNQNRGNVIDRAIVRFDGANDMHKFMLNPAHTNLSIAKGGETFAAISTETEGELPVNFKAEKNGTYTITVNTENVEANYLHLIDNLTGMDTDLLSTPSYTFDAKTSDYASRFKLVFGVKNDNEEMCQASSFAYINNGEIVISNEGRATLQVIDVLGRIVSSEEINGECRISTNGLTAGLYILNLNGMTQKIVVR